MAEEHGNSYTAFALAQSLTQRAAITALPLPAEVAQRYAAMAVESLALQKRMEEREKVPFEDWRRRYLSPEMLRP